MSVKIKAIHKIEPSRNNDVATLDVYFESTVLTACYASIIDGYPSITHIVSDQLVTVELPNLSDSGTYSLSQTPGFEYETCGTLTFTQMNLQSWVS